MILTIFFLSFIRINSFVNTASALPIPTANPPNITTIGNPADAPWITCDQTDYQPGALATLTGGGWNGDNEVKIVIEGASDNSKAWNLEKTVQVSSDGSIELKFNLPEKYIPKYKVTATGVTTGHVAANTFSDTATPYRLNFCTYNPDNYDFKLPTDYNTRPSSSVNNPMQVKDLYDTKESLEPEKLALGQIVPFVVQVDVNGSTGDKSGTINLTCEWDTLTSSKSNFGFDPDYMVYAAFVDTGDSRSIDTGTQAAVTEFTSVMDGSCIKGDFQVSGLDNGDRIIVEMWVVLKSYLPPGGVTGSIHSELTDAKTSDGTSISKGSGNQTIPFNQVEKFESAVTDVSIVKSDEPDPLYGGDNLTYTITVANSSAYGVVANGIVVTDQLDPNVTFDSASDHGEKIINQVDQKTYIVWPAFALEPGGTKTFTVSVYVKSDAPTDNCMGTAPDTGSATLTPLPDADITNIVKISNMYTTDKDISNNFWQEPTNVLPKATVTAHKIWVGGPEADHKAVTLTLYRQVGVSGAPEEVTGINPTVTPSQDGTTFTYVWTGLPMYDSKFNQYIYTAKELTVPANYNMTTGANNTITNTYKPSLTILKVYGTEPLEGAEFQLYKGNDSGPTDKYLDPVTTGSDGKAVLSNLDDGTYWLAEIKPPTGYKWISDIGPIKVANGTITGPKAFEPTEDETTCNYIITVPNEPIRELPATGGIGIIPFATGGIGLMIFAALMKKRNKIEGE